MSDAKTTTGQLANAVDREMAERGLRTAAYRIETRLSGEVGRMLDRLTPAERARLARLLSKALDMPL